MPISKPAPSEALTFAIGWIARNIDVGPFSCDDPPICDGPISLFRKEAEEAGFSEADLVNGIGPVPAFIEQAYADAVAKWRSTQNRKPETGPTP
jgi:hypothetical protein